MAKPILHITNGSSLTEYLKELDVAGDYLTWQEMLCEGPTVRRIDSEEFIETRKAFLNKEYDIIIDEYEFHNEIDKLNQTENYSEIVLWFEYDLFCHINLIAVISLIDQKKIDLPLSLVCSGRVKGEKGFKGLSELNPEQLLQHYKGKIPLLKQDVELATTLWGLYCGKYHNLIKPFIQKKSSFQYLTSCLTAHLKRFPDSKNGLSRLEQHILETINLNKIKSRNHLLGFVLSYQGYYGYGDLQVNRMIDKLSIFYVDKGGLLKLNRKGHEALLGQHNFALEVNNDIMFGGVKRLDYQYHKKSKKLIKTVINAN